MIITVPDDGRRLYPTLGPQVCQFIEENLIFGPGDLRGQPAVLDEEKQGLLYRMYEIFPKNHPRAGRRRFQRCALSLPKGLAKTEFAAWIAACELHPDAPVRFNGWDKNGKPKPGRPVKDPYIPMVAYTEEQSDELAYGALRAILDEGPVRNDFDIGLDRIVRAKGDGKAVSVASSPEGRDGARTTFAVMDETHWWTSTRLLQSHQTMRNNLAKRFLAEPWMLEITTAPEPGSGSVAEKTMEYGQAVKDGKIKDASLFFFHRQAAEEYDFRADTPAEFNLNSDEVKRAAVIEASGIAAEWRDIDAIVQGANDPTADLNFWRRVWLNQMVRSSRKAFDALLWKALQAAGIVQPGDDIALGFDGSMFHDSAGLVGTVIRTGFQFVLGAWERPPKARQWQVPASEVDDTVRAAFQQYNVLRMYADPPYWQSWIANWQGEYGEERVIEWWTNRRKPMSYAIESFDTAMKERKITHDGNVILMQHIGNSFKRQLNEKDEEGKALWLIEKERSDSPHKIDLAMAATLSWEARTEAIAAGALNSGWGPVDTDDESKDSAMEQKKEAEPAASPETEEDFIPVGEAW